MHPDQRCPCGSGLVYGECCGPLHAGSATAPTAEALMRSRFSAFAVGDEDYLLASWHSSTLPASVDLDARTRWIRLDILSRSAGGPFDERGQVEFEARYRTEDPAGGRSERGVLRERSRFVREGGRWYYVDGDIG